MTHDFDMVDGGSSATLEVFMRQALRLEHPPVILILNGNPRQRQIARRYASHTTIMWLHKNTLRSQESDDAMEPMKEKEAIPSSRLPNKACVPALQWKGDTTQSNGTHSSGPSAAAAAVAGRQARMPASHMDCVDKPWTNGFGHNCDDLAKNEHAGPNWLATNGVRADEACCIFGGGNPQSKKRRLTPVASIVGGRSRGEREGNCDHGKFHPFCQTMTRHAFYNFNSAAGSKQSGNACGCQGQVGWHPGWAWHQIIGTAIALPWLHALQQALTTDNPASTVEEAAKKALLPLPPASPACAEAASVFPEICEEGNVAVGCANEYLPRTSPSSVRSLLSSTMPTEREVKATLDPVSRNVKAGEERCNQNFVDAKPSIEVTSLHGEVVFELPGRVDSVMVCEPAGFNRPPDMAPLADERVRWSVNGRAVDIQPPTGASHLSKCATFTGLASTHAHPTGGAGTHTALAVEVESPGISVRISQVLWSPLPPQAAVPDEG